MKKNARKCFIPFVLFLVFVAAFIFLPFTAEAKDQNTVSLKQKEVQKPNWRVNDDAPYRVVPAHPPLKETGESLKDLGFATLEALQSSISKRSPVRSVALSADGRTLVSGSEDGTVKLWDVTSQKLLHTFEGHSSQVNAVALSADGATIVSGSWDKTVKLWDVTSQKLLHTFEGHSGTVNAVALSADGKTLVSGSWDKTVKLWDVTSQKLLHTFEEHSGTVNAVVLSADGKTLVSGSWDRTVSLWDVTSQKLLYTFEGHSSTVNAVALSADGKTIFSGSGSLFNSEDNSVKLWDVASKKLLHTFEGHSGGVSSVVLSADGKTLVSGSWDKTVKLWDVASKKLLHSFEGHSGRITSVALSADGSTLFSGSEDKSVKLWDIASLKLLHSFGGHSNWILSVALSADSSTLVSGSSDKTVKLWDVASKKLLHTFEGHSDWVLSVALSADSSTLVSGSYDNTVKLWSVTSQKLLHTFEGHSGRILSVALSADGSTLVSGSDDKTVKLWDVTSQKLLHTFKGHSNRILSVALSADGSTLVSGSYDKTVKLWDVTSQKLLHTFEGHSSGVSSVALSADGSILVSGSGDKTVKLWDVTSQKLLYSFKGHSSQVNAVALSADGSTLVSGSSDKTLKLWDVASQKLLYSFEGHSRPVNAVALSANSSILVSGSYDNTVKLWNMGNKHETLSFLGGQNGNWAVIENQEKIFRGDDGTFLGEEFPVKNMRTKDDLSLKLVTKPTPLQPGESRAVEVQITNRSQAATAYWLSLRNVASEDKAIRLDSPNREFIGRGRQTWKADRIAKLEPGETASLHARIFPNLKLPAQFVESGKRELTLTVVSANGTKLSKTIEVDLKSPKLEWQSASFDKKTETLKMTVINNGTAPLKDMNLVLSEDTSDLVLELPSKSELKPGETFEMAVPIPKTVDLKKVSLKLSGRTANLPIYAWNLASPKIEFVGRFSMWLLTPLLLLMIIAIAYLRRYRHPLVLQLSNNPATLLQLQPEQLSEAKIRLRKTRRLNTILSGIEVSTKRLDEGIAFFNQWCAEEKAAYLSKRLLGKLKVLQEVIPLWELRLSNDFPLNMDRCLLYFPSEEIEALDIFSTLKTIHQTQLRNTLIIGPNSAYQRKLHDKSKDRSNKWVAPIASEITRLLLSPDPEVVLAHIFASQLALTQLSPYQLGGGVNREAIFFGREATISHITNRDPANYLIVSGRQLGKSSLLKALERRYQEQDEVHCFYMALASEIFVPRLAAELKLPADAGLEEIAQHVSKAEGRFLFLIDEADKFIRYERENDYKNLDGLRRMSEEGHCTFILAGFWELYEHAVLDYQSPLKNFAETIQIGALEEAASRELAKRPMQILRLNYKNEALIDHLLESTGRRANLLAIVCHQILTGLASNQREITAGDIHRALHSEKTMNALKGWDAMTDDKKACELDRIVVYTTIDKKSFDFAELMDRLEKYKIKPEGAKLEHSLARLKLGFVLAQDEAGRYSYRVPLFKEMIQQDSPKKKLEIAVENWKEGEK